MLSSSGADGKVTGDQSEGGGRYSPLSHTVCVCSECKEQIFEILHDDYIEIPYE